MCQSSFCSWKAELGWLLLNWGETGSWQKRTWGLHRASAAAVCLKASRVIAKCLHLIWPHLYGVRTLIYYSLTCIWAEGREGQSYEMELPTSVPSERTKTVKRSYDCLWIYLFLPLLYPLHIILQENRLLWFIKKRSEVQSLTKSPLLLA